MIHRLTVGHFDFPAIESAREVRITRPLDMAVVRTLLAAFADSDEKGDTTSMGEPWIYGKDFLSAHGLIPA